MEEIPSQERKFSRRVHLEEKQMEIRLRVFAKSLASFEPERRLKPIEGD